MLCSRCSEIVKPVVAVDIDGTLGDYHGHFIRFAGDWLGQDLSLAVTLRGSIVMYDGVGAFSQYCIDLFDIDLATYRQIKLAYRQGGMKRSMPIFRGALDLCHYVRREGAELWVTTTRPYLSLDNIVPDTVEWLDRHRIAFDGMLFDEDKYEQLAARVDPSRVVAVFDDLKEMCVAADTVFGRPVAFMVRGRYNTGVVRDRVVDNLREARNAALVRIHEWRERHDNR